MRLAFHGAAGTVAGPKTLPEHAGRPLLLDCGLFGGLSSFACGTARASTVEADLA